MVDPDGARLGTAAAARLAALGSITIEPGLTDDELSRVEQSFGVEFADDHRSFLAAGLPVGASWPNWRSDGRRNLARQLRLPVEGVLFAVEWSGFWDDGWGVRPQRIKDALRTAKYRLARVPQLVPLYSNRYLPGIRGSFGHPVLSAVRIDVVVRGTDLADYIDTEFGSAAHRAPDTAATLDFWSALVS